MPESPQAFDQQQLSNDGAYAFFSPLSDRNHHRRLGPAALPPLVQRGGTGQSHRSQEQPDQKTDNIESYVYRNSEGNLCIPGEYLRQSVIQSAKYRQDPRSPRKSAMDLFKAGLVSLTELADTGKKDWDYLDQRRVVIQRSGVTRTRPALLAGWSATFQLEVLIPEYIDSNFLYEVLSQAGRLIGIGDFRPSYGRFQIVKFEQL